MQSSFKELSNLRSALKVVFGLVILIGLVVTMILFYWNHPVVRLNRMTNRLMSEKSLSAYQEWLDEYSKSNLFQLSQSDSNVTVSEYATKYAAYNKTSLFKLMPIDVINYRESVETIAFQTQEIPDAEYIEGLKYPLQTGIETVVPSVAMDIRINNQALHIEGQLDEVKGRDEVIAVGRKSVETVAEKLKAVYGELVASVVDEDEATFLANSLGTTETQFAQLITKLETKELLPTTSAKDLVISPEQKINGDLIELGDLEVTQANCRVIHYLPVYYHKGSSKYFLGNFHQLGLNLCNEDGFVQLDCQDCSLAPVDKLHKLPEGYVPVLEDTELPGGGRLHPVAAQALRELFAAANLQGVNPRVFSAYRSYEEQVNTYEYWVKLEMSRGLSREQAMVTANNYSALPGFSEHQLGMTVDLGCATCLVFDDAPGNLAVYRFLEREGYKFGFVISYPYNMYEQTGYKYEPWHVRYVGVAIAEELHKTGYFRGNGNYLAKLLQQKGLY